MNQQLSNKIKVYNFVFTIGIVIYHWKNFSRLFAIQQNVLIDRLYILYDTIGYIALGFFFMNSGYLLYQGVDHRQKLLQKLKRRVSSLIVPFLIWNVLMLAYQILYCFYSGEFDITLTDILLGFSFVPFDGPLWYMFALVLLLSLSPFIIKLTQYPKVFGGIVATAFICSFLCGVFVKTDSEVIGWIVRLVYYLPAYSMGSFLGLCKSDLVADELYHSKTVSVVCILLSVAMLLHILCAEQKSDALQWIMLHILPITIWLSFPNRLFEKIKITYPMQTTFFVYAMHSLVISIINTILTRIWGYNSMHFAVSINVHFVLVAVLYLLCMCFAFVTKKILPAKLFASISGGRT